MYVATYQKAGLIIWNALLLNVYHRIVLFFSELKLRFWHIWLWEWKTNISKLVRQWDSLQSKPSEVQLGDCGVFCQNDVGFDSIYIIFLWWIFLCFEAPAVADQYRPLGPPGGEEAFRIQDKMSFPLIKF